MTVGSGCIIVIMLEPARWRIQSAHFVLHMSTACRPLTLADVSLNSAPLAASSDLHLMSATFFRSGYLHSPSLRVPRVSESSLRLSFLCF